MNATGDPSPLYSPHPNRAALRGLAFLLTAIIPWLMVALTVHPPLSLPDFLRALVAFLQGIFAPTANLTPFSQTAGAFIAAAARLGFQTLQALFAPDILRHGLLLAFPCYFACRLAAAYVDHVYGIQDSPASTRFILQSVFGLRPPRLTIADGAITTEDAARIDAIGGPALVEVNLENVAVFELPDGSADVVGPGDRCYLSAFERLRDVIDLRDQMTRTDELNVVGRTRDGIRLAARDVRLVYSVLRLPLDLANTPDRPAYSYQEAAIQALVFDRTADHWSDVMIDLVREHLQRFIASHTLSEILTAVGAPEVQARLIEDAALRRPGAAFSSPIPVADETSRNADTDPKNFIPRLALTDLFFAPNGDFAAQADARGVQLHWIDVGTWTLPNQFVAETQMEAWKLSRENEALRRQLASLSASARSAELLRIVHEVPLSACPEADVASTSSADLSRRLLSAHLTLLHTARESYLHDQTPVPPALEKAIQTLSRI